MKCFTREQFFNNYHSSTPCIPKAIWISTLALAVLLGVGALVSHFMHFGTIYSYSFAAASGGSTIATALLYLTSRKQKGDSPHFSPIQSTKPKQPKNLPDPSALPTIEPKEHENLPDPNVLLGNNSYSQKYLKNASEFNRHPEIIRKFYAAIDKALETRQSNEYIGVSLAHGMEGKEFWCFQLNNPPIEKVFRHGYRSGTLVQKKYYYEVHREGFVALMKGYILRNHQDKIDEISPGMARCVFGINITLKGGK
jgi:hypothetical protein